MKRKKEPSSFHLHGGFPLLFSSAGIYVFLRCEEGHLMHESSPNYAVDTIKGLTKNPYLMEEKKMFQTLLPKNAWVSASHTSEPIKWESANASRYL